MLYLNISSTNYQNDVIWRSIKSNLKVINKSGIPIQFNQAVKASFEFCNREIFIVKEKKEDIDKVYGIFVSNKNFNIISNKAIFEAYGDEGLGDPDCGLPGQQAGHRVHHSGRQR